MGRISPNYYVQDGVVPRTKLPEVLARIRALSERTGLGIGNVFHAGDGNLHPLICYDESIPGQAQLAEEVAGEILDLLRRGRRLDHRRARRRRRQARLHAADVLRRRPRGDAAGARRDRSAAPLQSRQGAADAAAVRRGARAVSPASRSSRPASPSGSDDRVRLHRPGAPDDAIDGVMPAEVRRTRDRREALADGARRRDREPAPTVVRGGGTKLAWGRRARRRRSRAVDGAAALAAPRTATAT